MQFQILPDPLPGQMWMWLCLWRLSASKSLSALPTSATPSHKQLWAQRQSCCCRNGRNGTNGKWEMVMEICLALGQSSLPLSLLLLPLAMSSTLSAVHFASPLLHHLSCLLALPSVRAKGQLLPAAKWSTVTVTDWWQTAFMYVSLGVCVCVCRLHWPARTSSVTRSSQSSPPRRSYTIIFYCYCLFIVILFCCSTWYCCKTE